MLLRLKSVLLASAVVVGLFSGLGTAPAAEASAAPRVFANCTAMQKVYPHGVGKVGAKDKGKAKNFKPVTTFKKNTALYNANAKHDRDKDGVACEKK